MDLESFFTASAPDPTQAEIESYRERLRGLIDYMRNTSLALLSGFEAETYPYATLTPLDEMLGLFVRARIKVDDHNTMKDFVGEGHGQWSEWYYASNTICRQRAKTIFADMVTRMDTATQQEASQMFQAMSINLSSYTGFLKDKAEQMDVLPSIFINVYQHYALQEIKLLAARFDLRNVSIEGEVCMSNLPFPITSIAFSAELDDKTVKDALIPTVERVDMALPAPKVK